MRREEYMGNRGGVKMPDMNARLIEMLARTLETMEKATGGEQHKAAMRRVVDALRWRH
jgi:hypothetical protein